MLTLLWRLGVRPKLLTVSMCYLVVGQCIESSAYGKYDRGPLCCILLLFFLLVLHQLEFGRTC